MVLTVTDSVKASFLAGDHNVSHCLAVLPPFWGAFDVPISVKHLQ
jgi:hypothetical protein